MIIPIDRGREADRRYHKHKKLLEEERLSIVRRYLVKPVLKPLDIENTR